MLISGYENQDGIHMYVHVGALSLSTVVLSIQVNEKSFDLKERI